jgi:hypothetical protein
MKATNLLHRAMRAVYYRHIVITIEMAIKSGYILHYCCVDCRPGSHRGDTEQVVTRWRRSVSGKALVMLHRAMRSVSHRRTAMAIEMARDGGTFVHRRRLFRLL